MATFELDSTRRTVRSAGRETRLPNKTWRVLERLQSASPEMVSRQTLIDEIWNGQQFTGDKGLNQAMWQLRTALGDDARSPGLIETIPRVGYRWRAPNQSPEGVQFGWQTGIASILVMLLLVYLPISSNELTAASAKLVNQDIVVDMTAGCRLIIKPAGGKSFLSPMISKSGDQVAVQVINGSSCELAVIDINDHSHQNFGACPTL